MVVSVNPHTCEVEIGSSSYFADGVNGVQRGY